MNDPDVHHVQVIRMSLTLLLLFAAVLIVGVLVGVLAKMPVRQIAVMCIGMAAVALVFYGLAELV